MFDKPESKCEKGQKGYASRRPKESVVIRVFRALKRHRHRARKNESQSQANERALTKWTRWVSLFTGALVIVSAVTAWIFEGQLHAMRDQLNVSEREARIRLRSYVTIAAVRSPLEIGKPLTATVIVGAGGQTPATNVQASGHIGSKPFPLRDGDIIIDAPGKEANSISLNPGDRITLPSVTAPINQAAVDLLKSGQAQRFYMWGRITYRDVFGCHRWQNYCFRVNDANGSNPADIDPCTKYNDAEGAPGACPSN